MGVFQFINETICGACANLFNSGQKSETGESAKKSADFFGVCAEGETLPGVRAHTL
jgi:hypothetical protein